LAYCPVVFVRLKYLSFPIVGMEFIIDVPHEKEPNLLFALVVHGLQIEPMGDAYENEAEIRSLTREYTRPAFDILYFRPPTLEDEGMQDNIALYDSKLGETRGRLTVTYHEDTPPVVLHQLYLALREVGLREEPFPEL
jgi:hypothetical protein